jgi:hypothetical protein
MLLLVIAVLFKLHIQLADDSKTDSKAFCEDVMDYKIYCALPKPFNMREYAPRMDRPIPCGY